MSCPRGITGFRKNVLRNLKQTWGESLSFQEKVAKKGFFLKKKKTIMRRNNVVVRRKLLSHKMRPRKRL